MISRMTILAVAAVVALLSVSLPASAAKLLVHFHKGQDGHFITANTVVIPGFKTKAEAEAALQVIQNAPHHWGGTTAVYGVVIEE
jgi:hypothetical protein